MSERAWIKSLIFDVEELIEFHDENNAFGIENRKWTIEKE